jgi:hypothetical protein
MSERATNVVMEPNAAIISSDMIPPPSHDISEDFLCLAAALFRLFRFFFFAAVVFFFAAAAPSINW